MIIRKLVPADAAAFKDLRIDAVQNSPASFYPSFEDVTDMPIAEFQTQLGSSSQDSIFGAFEEGSLLASAGLRRDRREKIKHKALIWGAYTKPAYRGRGIARQLVSIALEDARTSSEILLITLSVNTENIAAKSLYESFGFSSYGIERNAMYVNGVFIHEDHMSLAIGI
jgi:RimJ/RimL family protein N-acetyltransferase